MSPKLRLPQIGNSKNKQGAKGDTNPSRRPEIPRTVLNFVAEQTQAKAAATRSMRTVGVIAGVVVLLVFGYGFMVRQQASSAQVDKEKVFLETQRLRTQLGQQTGGENVLNVLTARRAELEYALTFDSDVPDLVSQVMAATPANVQVTVIKLSTAAPTPSKGTGTKTTTTTTKPGGDAGPAVSLSTKSTERTVTMTATTPDAAAAVAWKGSLLALGIFKDVTVSPTTKNNSVAVEVKAVVSDAALQSRRTQILAGVPSLKKAN